MRPLITLLLFIGCSFCLHATHNIGGTISYRHLSGNTYQITVVTTTNYSGPAVNADRCEQKVYIQNAAGSIIDSVMCPRVNGTGSCSSSPSATNGVTIMFGSAVYKQNVYQSVYTFNTGSYTLIMMDANLTGGIINITGDSSQQPMVVMAGIEINPFTSCPVNSAVCGNYSLGFASLHNNFSYSSFTTDMDGDSLWFDFIPTPGQSAQAIPGYIFPSAYGITIDHQTGRINWPNPSQQGLYLFTVKVSQYRNGYYVGYITHNISVNCAASGTFSSVFQTGNGSWMAGNPPSLHAVPGVPVNFTVIYKCLGISGSNMTATIGDNPAWLTMGSNVIGDSVVFNSYGWTPAASDAREQPYLFSFEVLNAVSSNSFFSDAYTVLVYVDGGTPAPLCPALALHENKEDRLLYIFPTPAKDYLELQFAEDADCNRLILVNAIGQEILTSELAQSSKSVVLNVSGIPGGMYYLILKNNQSIVTRKKVIIAP
jgi:hypothetical protein